MNFFKTAFFTSIATGTRLATGFVITKFLAIIVGPGGYAVVGQFQNCVNLVLNISGNVFQNGVVKYTAQYSDQDAKRLKFLSSAFIVCIFSSIATSFGLVIFRTELASYFLKDASLSWLFLVFGATVGFYVLNTFFISIMNGHRAFRRMTIANIVTSVTGLVFSITLIYFFQLHGALLAIILSQSVVFFISMFLLYRANWFNLRDLLSGFEKEQAFNLIRFSTMTIASTSVTLCTQIYIRNYIVSEMDWQQAGYWQASVRLSETYLTFLSVAISTYYMPTLSSGKSNVEIRRELKKAYFNIIPLVLIGVVIIYACKELIIQILFSKSFFPVKDLLFFQLMGDVVKVASWLIVYNLLAKEMIKLFILMELLFGLFICILTSYFITQYGLLGAPRAYFMTYSLYWVFVGSLFIYRIRLV